MLSIGMVSETGVRLENQDAVGFAWSSGGHMHLCYGGHEVDLQVPFQDDMVMSIVCDGMGGLKDGAVASRTIVDGVLDAMHGIVCSPDPVSSLVDRIGHLEGLLMMEHPDSGTTLSIVLLTDDACTSIHLGDSRCYTLRGDKLWRTSDHSPVEGLFQRGIIREEDMNDHPLSNVVSRYIGGGYAEGIMVQPIPEDWDTIVLCTDGAFGYMSPESFHRTIATSEDPQDIVDGALFHGSSDNVTVVMIRDI